jgi:hypothetical protein
MGVFIDRVIETLITRFFLLSLFQILAFRAIRIKIHFFIVGNHIKPLLSVFMIIVDAIPKPRND